MGLPDDALALLALPPDRFVAQRDALARELAARDDRAAGEVRRLRRPAGLAWILNRLARERRGDVEALLRAGDRLRVGHRRALAGKGAEELRAAEEELREHARELRARAGGILEGAGRRADRGTLSRVELLLRLVATAPGPEREAFRRGALAAEPAPAPADAGGLAVLAAAGSTAARAPERREGGETAPRAAEARAREERRQARLAERRREAAERELSRAEAAARRAEETASRGDAAARRAADRARELRARAEALRAEVARRRDALRAP
ncbi:MAG TPA: hypothetical protein VIW03_01845 [Anaeromyxobacter sp.]